MPVEPPPELPKVGRPFSNVMLPILLPVGTGMGVANTPCRIHEAHVKNIADSEGLGTMVLMG